MPNTKSFLTPSEVAELLHVSPITVRSWANKGLLCAETTPGGHRRYARQEVERFLELYPVNRAMSEESLTVLIVDDDPHFRGFLLELLDTQTNAIRCETAANGFEAGSKIHTFQPNVVLLDVLMPGIGGLEICRQIKQNPDTQAIRVIAITGDPSAENRQNLLAAGAECCLGKPVNTAILLEMLNKPAFEMEK